VIGSKRYKEEISRQLEQCELSLRDFTVQRKQSDKYLGQILHTDGVRSSVEATIADREGKLKGAIFEVKSIVEDFQMQAVGGMMAAWELWEKAMVPSLLSGAGTWVGATVHFNADKFECMRLWPNPSLAPDYDYLGPDGEVIEVKPSL
jgi:hypothetical protein